MVFQGLQARGDIAREGAIDPEGAGILPCGDDWETPEASIREADLTSGRGIAAAHLHGSGKRGGQRSGEVLERKLGSTDCGPKVEIAWEDL